MGEERKESPGSVPRGEDSSGDFSVGPELVAAMLEGRLLEETSLNAATGYQLDPRMPAPEVFERPDWGITMVEPGMRTVEVAEFDTLDMASVSEELPEPSAHVIETSVVEPEVWALLRVRGWSRGWRYGLGYHVGSRQLFLFSTPGAP